MTKKSGATNIVGKSSTIVGRCGCEMVCVLALYPDGPSSNPAEVYNYSVKLLLIGTKINKKRPGLAHFFKKATIGKSSRDEKMFIHFLLVIVLCALMHMALHEYYIL